MKYLSKYFWIIFIIVSIIGTIIQLPNLKNEPITPKGQNYVVIDNKVVPLTRLSEEDIKKPCTECHKK